MGSQVEDTSGDEEDGMDDTILPCDYDKAGVIIDDDLHEYLVACLPVGVTLVSLMDCCHSGSALDLEVGYIADQTGGLKKRSFKRKIIEGAIRAGLGAISMGQMADLIPGMTHEKKKKSEVSLPNPGNGEVYLYSGCRDDQVNKASSPHSFTHSAITKERFH